MGAAPATKRQRTLGKQPKFVVLDIEGTVAAIGFVTKVLFPYARENVGKFLLETFDSAETQQSLEALRKQHAMVCPLPHDASPSLLSVLSCPSVR